MKVNSLQKEVMNKTGNWIAFDLITMGEELITYINDEMVSSALATGNHSMAWRKTAKADYGFAVKAVDLGIGDSELLRMGMWLIKGKFHYYPGTGKWGQAGKNKYYHSKSLESFLLKVGILNN